MNDFKLLLSLDLQYFAEPGEPGEPGHGEPGGQTEPGAGEKTFTQTELDRIIADRLQREKDRAQKELEKQAQEAERKRLEEQNEFKTLYEQAQTELMKMQAAQEAAILENRKQSLIIGAGYSADQLEDLKALVTGATEDEIIASFERIKKLIPVKPHVVDPTLQGSQRSGTMPKTKDSYEQARERARSLLKRK